MEGPNLSNKKKKEKKNAAQTLKDFYWDLISHGCSFDFMATEQSTINSLFSPCATF